ncbi:vWA domain-containing protein [Ferruginibacter sp.]|nr:VWA domain-containing protein [Ferruginibacter sp.]
MKISAKAFFALFSIAGLITLISFTGKPQHKKPVQPKIQAAILLDVSGSMDGLIEQAKAQLWNMVSTMGKAKCSADVSPQIEIALYEYGRSTNDIKAGYVKQLSGFTSDLDSLSKILFSLKTNGGDEYCGQVIQTSLKELQWDAAPENYKVIFIAGNEDFLQGNVLYTSSCNDAKNKGVIVNTIYCGDRMQGIREHWNLNSECGNGSFTNINQNDKIDDIPTPYDSLIITMNGTLNQTYMAYNSFGYNKMREVVAVDAMNSSMSKSAGIKRTKVKGNSKIYNQASWDLVDAKEKDKDAIAKIDRKTLPDSLQKKTNEELEQIVEVKRQQRSAAQKEIETLNAKRDAYIAAEKAKNAANKNNAATLETEVEKIIKEQAKRYNMKIE